MDSELQFTYSNVVFTKQEMVIVLGETFML